MRMSDPQEYVKRVLLESWHKEMEAASLYSLAAQKETDARRQEILRQLATIELSHADLWLKKLEEIGVTSMPAAASTEASNDLPAAEILAKLEALEESNASWYEWQKQVIADEGILQIIDRIDEEESAHDSGFLTDVFRSPIKGITQTLGTILGRESWHKKHTSGWIGDAIYGVNDGLGAIFGIIAGVAGYTDNSHTVLVSGFFGALASTLSMGAGAWLATKSENELAQKEMEHERREFVEQPDLEKEEMKLIYQLKGFTPLEASDITERLAQDADQFVKVMAQEELGLQEESAGNPWRSAFIGSISTLVGGVLPLIPFFFASGITAMILAAIVSILAHFAVGAAKSIVTTRGWLASGLEMTAAGIIVGVVSYGIGILGTLLIHA